jgi:hypothetical protein
MISDEDLLLYYYRDGLDAADRARIGAALAEQPELARRLHALVARLDAVAATPDVPVPAVVQQRWRDALERAANETHVAAEHRRLFTQPRWLAAAAAVAVVALVVILQQARTPVTDITANNPVPMPTQPDSATQDPAAYENGLKWHLASTERQLATLGTVSPGERARLIETIVSQNRMYALAAERAGEPQLARVLRAFTPILEGMESGESPASGIAQLSFELRVMQARLGAGVDTQSNTL